MNTPDIELKETCGACPEAYDVFFDEEYGVIKIPKTNQNARCSGILDT
jgi:hypothetical protein